jgi:hypothetical protein
MKLELPSGLSDYSLLIQQAGDACIASGITDLYLPDDMRLPCKTPLIFQNYQANQGAYWPFTLHIRGNKSYTGADGTGTILDFSSLTDGFGIGIQGGKGCSIIGVEINGSFVCPVYNVKDFYASTLGNYSTGKCSEAKYHPYLAVAQDPFGPHVPVDGGYTGNDAYGKPLSSYYKGSTNGSTGLYMNNLFLRGFVAGYGSSVNGQTFNGDMVVGDRIQFGNLKYNVICCQDQEKMVRFTNCISWLETHTIFGVGIFGASSPGNFFFDHWNIAGLTNQLVYLNEGGYFQCQMSDMTIESLGRIGPWYTVNGSKITNSKIDFAGYLEAGFYIKDQFSGYGLTLDGCQLRTYGQPTPLTIDTGAYANNYHFINCSFDCVPFYPQNYAAGYTDFMNCYVGGQSSANVLNPIGPSTPSIYAYPTTSDVAGKIQWIDDSLHNISGTTIIALGTFKIGQPIIGTTSQFIFKMVVGVISAIVPGGFTIAYTDPSIDLTQQYYLGTWQTIMK